MQKLTIELTDPNSLKVTQDLEQKRIIRIVNYPDLDSYALPGNAISEEDFKQWVEYAQESPSISITEARERWALQKKKLEKLIR